MNMDSSLLFGLGIGLLGLLFWYWATNKELGTWGKRNIGTILVLYVLTLCVASIFPMEEKLKKGIDIAGGSLFALRVQPNESDNGKPLPVSPESVQSAKETVEKRLNASGIGDLAMQSQGKDRFVVEMSGVKEEEVEAIKEKLQKVAKLEMKQVYEDDPSLAYLVDAGQELAPAGYKLYHETRKDDNGNETKVPHLLSKRNIVDGSQIAYAGPNRESIGMVNIELTNEGGKRMSEITSRMRISTATSRGDRMASVLDGEIVQVAYLNDRLGKNFTISGLDNKAEVKRVSEALSNPLKNPLVLEEERSIPARLGEQTVSQGITAGLIGLAITFVFIVLYYRAAGALALIALISNVIILFGTMALFGFTFTLPGIAGIILTIGVAVDANVLIYERAREEIAAGAKPLGAIRLAFEKAATAIIDANITTLITAIILYALGSGTVKGFAVTLTIGIFATMFAALVTTRVLFWWTTLGDKPMIKSVNFADLVGDVKVKFLQMRKKAFIASAVLVGASVLLLVFKGNSSLGIDFKGGNKIQFILDESAMVEAAEVNSFLATAGDWEKNPVAQNEFTQNSSPILSIKCADVETKNELGEVINTEADQVIAAVKGQFPALAAVAPSVEKVSGSLGEEFLWNSLNALGWGLALVMLYIALRFEFSFSIGAIAALVHDLAIVFGLLLIMGVEISLIHVGAFLTIVGYSINDTIVVFDRIREYLRDRDDSILEVMNAAINSTLSRTVITSVTTFVMVLILYIFGGSGLKDFSLTIMLGVAVGTYSSIFIAAPIVYIWAKKRGGNLRSEIGLELEDGEEA